MLRRTLRGGIPIGILPVAMLLAPVLATAGDMSLAIVPPYVEKVVRPGSSLHDTLSFTNEGTEPVLVSVDFADFGVSQTGEVFERPPGSDTTTLVRNLRVSPLNARVVPKQKVFFRYSVDTPESFEQLRTMIYLSSQPEVPPGVNQVQVVARMGVPLYVESIKAEPARLELGDIEWSRLGTDGERLQLSLSVTNRGGRNIRPGGYVRVRSADRKFDRSFDFNEGREPVLPGQIRRWQQQFGPVPQGELTVKLRLATSDRATHEAEARIPPVVP